MDKCIPSNTITKYWCDKTEQFRNLPIFNETSGFYTIFFVCSISRGLSQLDFLIAFFIDWTINHCWTGHVSLVNITHFTEQ